MKHSRRNSVLTTAVLGGCLTFGLAGPVAADTSLDVENDGLVVSAFVSSSKDVLSINIRVVGPDGFVFEDRVEDSAIQWIPEGDLADGIYRWEVRTVTLEPGAPARELTTAAQIATTESQGSQAMEVTGEKNSKPDMSVEIPVDRHFDEEHKNVESKSGSFRVRDGWIEPNGKPDGAGDAVSVGSTAEPGVFGTVVGAIVDFVFPSAHAQQTFTDDVEIDKTNPTLIFETNFDSNTFWQNFVFSDEWTVRYTDDTISTITPLTLEKNAPEDSMVINEFGNIGLGTASPTEDFHIADGVPRIRIEDTTDAQSWYVKNTNAGRFEIAETNNNSGAFVIKPGAALSSITIDGSGSVGIGTDTPARPLHVAGSHIRIEQTSSTWDLNPGSQGLWFSQASPGSRFGVLKLQNDAPEDSIVANATGVGIGTDLPETPVHVLTSEGADTNMVLLSNDGGSRIYFRNRTAPESGNDSRSWVFSTTEPGFRVSRTFSGQTEMELDNAGNLNITGTLNQGSSRAIKNNIEPLSGAKVLANLSKLEFNEWSYNQAPNQRHAGPMAEDFFDTFGLGPDNKHIAPGDMAGLSLAAAKALYEENQQLKARLARIENAMATNSNL
ncbi:MAG: tail fiber domain-containing protein [Wenzhouxiangellaceae bacterium]